MTSAEADESIRQPLNRIVKVADDVLAAIGPDKSLWRLDVGVLRSCPDFSGVDDLSILGVLEQSTDEELLGYGARRQSNPRVQALGNLGLRELRQQQ